MIRDNRKINFYLGQIVVTSEGLYRGVPAEIVAMDEGSNGYWITLKFPSGAKDVFHEEAIWI